VGFRITFAIGSIAGASFLMLGALVPDAAAAAELPPPLGIAVAQSPGGPILVDSAGFSLYVRDADAPGVSRCYARCAEMWPPLTAPPGAAPAGTYTFATRTDGTLQWAHDGRPLYRYAKDAQPGQTNGDGVAGIWHLARPASGLRTIGRAGVKARASSGYRAFDASTATKTDTPLMETPLNVQVVTAQVLQDQQAIGIDKVVANVSGVTVGSGGAADNGQPFSSIFLRGFSTDAHFRDGVRIDSFGGDSNTFDLQLANVESVDILKGPAGILYGAVEPGGIVNIVTKQPQSTPSFSLDQEAGSFGLARSTFDATGPLGADGHFGYRLDASTNASGSFVNYVYDNDNFLAPTVRWDSEHGAQVSLEYEYHHADFGQNYGFLPLLDGKPFTPISTNYGDWSPDIENSNLFSIIWKQVLGRGWSLRTAFLNNDTDQDSAGIFPDEIVQSTLVPSGFAVGRAINQVHNYDETWTLSSDLTKKFGGTVKQTLLIGADFVHFNSLGGILQSGQLDDNVSYVDLFHPNGSGTPFVGAPTPFIVDFGTNGSLGAYVQDQVAFPGGVYVLAGARYQEIHQTSALGFVGPALPNPKLDAQRVTPRLGVLWQPRDWLSLYGNVAGNFGPNTPGYITPEGDSVPPTSAGQWEFGAKTSLLGNKLTASLDYYNLVKTNLPTPDLANPDFVLVTGAARSNGVEFDLQGALGGGWNAIANYANANVFVTRSTDPANPPGTPFGEVPKYVDYLWLTHSGRVESRGLRFGAGVTLHASEPYLYPGTSGLRLPNYALYDAMLAYGFDSGRIKVRPQINVQNVFGKRYLSDAQDVQWASVAPYTAITGLWGAPRQINASASLQF
jgi:iron complex outermembrane receptor protein